MITQSVCRFCSSTNTCLNIFASTEMLAILSEHFKCDISESDRLPKMICEKCWTTTNEFHQLYVKSKVVQQEFLNKLIKTEYEWNDIRPDGNKQTNIENDTNVEIGVIKVEPITEFISVFEEYGFGENSQINRAEITDKVATVDENGNHEHVSNMDLLEEPNDFATGEQAQKKLQRMQKEAKFQKLFDENKHLLDLKCDYCSKVFDSFNECRNHYANAHHVAKGYIKCCGLKLHFPCQIESHLDRHLRPDKYKCTECGRMLCTTRDLEKHMKLHLKESPNGSITCDICKKVFTSRHGLCGHIKQHRKLSESDEEYKFMIDNFDMSCDHCDAVFKSFDEARSHYKQIHNESSGNIKCCGITFKKTLLIRDHIKTHLNPESFKCDECGKNYSSQMILVRHKRRHKLAVQKKFICDFCGKSFSDKEVLKRHLFNNHVQSEPTGNECQICHKKFHLPGQLRMHYYSVHREKKANITCEICGKSFHLKFHLNSHMQSHIDKSERLAQRMQCAYCGEWLLTKSGMYYHEKIHNSEPQKCDQCQKVFAHRLALKLHIRNSHRERKLKCSICDKRFDISSKLKRHESSHSRNKIHSCKQCPKTFYVLSSLVTHVRRKHRSMTI